MRVLCAERLARIEQLLKDRIEQAQQEHQRIYGVLSKHENRISILEKWQHWVVGAAAVVGSGITLFWERIKNL